MKFTIVGKNIEITEGIKNAIETKLEKFNKYFSKEEVECRVLARTYNVGTKLEVTIFLPNITLRAEVTDPDLYNAMDLAVEKLDGQVRKLKTKMDRRNKISLAEAMALENIEAEKDNENDQIIRTKSIYLEPMTIDDAIIKMEAIGHSFFVYLDKEENRISVVYRRLEGGYGILEVENNLK